MSLYNMLFGLNEAAPVLLAVLNLTPSAVGRFRDAYLDGDMIVVHTRNGGGNRECYCRDYARDEDTPTVEWEGETHREHCLPYINDCLARHPQYLRDEDDDFDCTYADFFFSFPPDYAADLAALSAKQGEPHRPSARWQEMLAKLSDPATPKDDPDILRAKAVGEQVIPPILDALTAKGTAKNPTAEAAGGNPLSKGL